MRCCQFAVNIVLYHGMIFVESNFDTDVGLGVGVDFYFYTVSASLYCETNLA
jgi:hypothetical protein